MKDPTNILPELQGAAVEIDVPKYHPKNARTHDIPKIQSSLARNGQYKKLTVQKSTGYVLAGNGTLEAARGLGWKRIAVEELDVGDQDAIRIVLADNKTGDGSSYEVDKLVELIKELDGDYDGSGYEEDDVAKLLGEDGGDDPYDSEVEEQYATRWEVVVECRDEAQQQQVFERLEEEGLTCRVLSL